MSQNTFQGLKLLIWASKFILPCFNEPEYLLGIETLTKDIGEGEATRSFNEPEYLLGIETI